MKSRYLSHVTTIVCIVALGVSVVSLYESRALRAELIGQAKVTCNEMKDHDLRHDCLHGISN